MKRKLAYLVIGLMLCTHTEFGQFFRVAFLVQHYFQHVERDHSLSLAGFLEMHYWGTDIADNDQQEDEQLPFKSFTINLYQVFLIPARYSGQTPTPFRPSRIFFLPRNSDLPKGYLHALLKPPRYA
ncbi:hypothetical protein LQ567_07090 [Niabella pedocola]|uniref:Secreted protein n=1 Tax=Niabella pedocola TaxID=1752077 RepID=A0ABS8PN41_9BACT|nr:hypothetical protein [Niabella pedocola]MCD2422523.1 hypothetical protein [Niabella pedocola]